MPQATDTHEVSALRPCDAPEPQITTEYLLSALVMPLSHRLPMRCLLSALVMPLGHRYP